MAASLNARDVTSLLFKSTYDKPADLTGSDLKSLDLAGLDFKRAKLAGADLYGSDLTGANLAATDLRGVRLDRSTIIRAEFSSANLEHATILRPNAFSDFVPDMRESPRFAGARMAGVRIVARLDGTDFRWADLTGAVFGVTDARREVLLTSQVRMDAADFSEATLKDAVLAGSSLRFAKFTSANLHGADLRGADLTRADFTDADVTGADVSGANLDEANFTRARGFSDMKGVATARNADRLVHERATTTP
jgi:uncharacterized protein YjbI with pentapeptide repeats